ncbi:MAG TPA: phosphoglucosamine mutase [Acidobacteriota bacterium]|nr:phosphoglucosamine mutase [Acidobacteriota bacterium]
MGRMFGTDGVRGVANVHPMTAEMALEIGRAAAYVCKKIPKKRHAIAIGKDTRISGYMIESALMAGICSMGVDVLLVGPMSTPGIAFITKSMKADAGVVISASHNPYQDNGIKIFSRDGFKLPDADEDEIEELIASGRVSAIRPTADELGKAYRIGDARGRYIVFCKNSFPDDMNLEGMKIVLDCANGATYKMAPSIFFELGADVTTLFCAPDGININDNCGSQHTETLADKVRATGADVGLAFDGDGDRLIAIDENGERLTGDHIMAICAKMYKEMGLLKNNLVVTTVMSNFGFFAAMKRLSIDNGVSKVGDRYVLEMMREKGGVIGGEESGHVIFLDHHTTGDGIITALQLLRALRYYRRPLSELAKVMTISPQKIENVDVGDKPPLETIVELQKAIAAAEAELGDKGRVLIRYSGTQSMCRVMVEGPTGEITARLTKMLAETVRKCIG